MSDVKIYDVVGITDKKDKDGEVKSYFKNCGVAFPLKKQHGLSVEMHAHAVSGRYLIMERKKKEEKTEDSF